tara:strand:- start:1060 stop:1368 length:309 start_codon:yes stop_codon:yes gene_type:complete
MCDRIISTAMLYTGNYGYIPNTLAGDGDPLDVLLLCESKIYPATIIKVKVIGALITEDENGMDEKIIAVPSNSVDKRSNHIHSISDIRQYTLNKISHLFSSL